MTSKGRLATAQVCAVLRHPVSLLAAAVLLLALGAYRFEGEPSWESSATVAGGRGEVAGQAEPAVRPRVKEAYGKLPLSFEANRGQTDQRVRFVARGRGYTLFLTRDSAVLTLRKGNSNGKGQSAKGKSGFQPSPYDDPRSHQERPAAHQGTPDLSFKPAAFPAFFRPPAAESNDDSAFRDQARIPDPESRTPVVLRMRLTGTNEGAKVTGLEELPGKSNYFIGNDPRKWRTNVPNYAKVKYANIYPGVDLVYYGNQGQLEYDFVVQPGGDPKSIQLAIISGERAGSRQRAVGSEMEAPNRELESQSGIDNRRSSMPLRIDGNGHLVVETDGGEVVFQKPVIYQPRKNHEPRTKNQEPRTANKKVIDGKYALKGDRVTFEVAGYDRTRPLVIDPTLVYSTYLGGSDVDEGHGIALDASGNAYVVGLAISSNFPTTAGAFQATYGGNGDAFVTKLNAAGSALLYSTYLGGSGNDFGFAIAVDASGNAYVTGLATSSDFPTTSGAFQTTYGGLGDAFVTKLSPGGSGLVYSTYLGGSDDDQDYGIRVDASGNAYVTGSTDSSNFPTTAGAFQTTFTGGIFRDAFVSKLNVAGSALSYSTYLGGTEEDEGSGIAVDSSGNAYVTGVAGSGFPTTAGAFQTTFGGVSDAFVTKLNAAGSALLYSSYLGGANLDIGYGVAVDASGNAYVTGFADSSNFPTTAGAFQTTYGGDTDAFVTKLNAAGSALLYSTYLGGSGTDGPWAFGLAVDASGNAYITSRTFSSNFPTTAGAFQTTYGGNGDAFVTKLNAAGSALLYSTYLGGSDDDEGHGIALDASGNAYVVGSTDSSNFPTTAGSFQTTYGGNGDAFISKFNFGVGPPTNTAQCKNGGWEVFTIPQKFKNQGDCVSFVNTGK